MDERAKKAITRVRYLLLAACYGVTMISVMATVALLYEYFVEIPSSIKHLVLAVQSLVCMAGIIQIAADEILLRPFKERLTPGDDFDMRKVAISIFGLMMAVAAAAYVVYRLTMGPGARMRAFIAVAFIASLISIAIMSIVLKSKTDPDEDINLADCLLKLPVRAASVTLVSWTLASIGIWLSFLYLGGLSSIKSFSFGSLGLLSGVLAFPLLYLYFKRILGPIAFELKERGMLDKSGGFMVAIRHKLLVQIVSVVLFSAGFFGLLSFLKADTILRDQADLFISKNLEKLADDAENLSASVKEFAARHGSFGFVLENGKILYTKAPEKYKELISALAGSDPDAVKRLGGRDMVLYRDVPGKDIRYGLIYPRKLFDNYLNELRNSGITFTVLALLISIIIAYFAASDISQPIESMKTKVAEFSKTGGLWKQDFLADDESADLEDGFRTMAVKIDKELGRARILAGNIEMTVDHLRKSADQMRVIANEQSSGTQEQASAIHEALSTAEEIAASAHQIAQNAGTVQMVADKTKESADRSTELIAQTIQGMDEVREQVDKVAHIMLELGERSQKIGAVIDIIQEISEQTSLLSLNASIEADSAGLQGMRFKVVAGEVKRLAKKTDESTGKIRQLITEIQKATTAAIMQVEESTKAVDAWSEDVIEVGNSFKQIEWMVDSSTSAVGEIKASTQQQTTACEQMADVISEVKQVADRVVVASSETEQSMADLSNLTVKLKKLIMTSEETHGTVQLI